MDFQININTFNIIPSSTIVYAGEGYRPLYEYDNNFNIYLLSIKDSFYLPLKIFNKPLHCYITNK